MEPLPYNIGIKNRAHRSENMWAPPSNQNLPSFTIHNSNSSKNNQTAMVYAYLVVEKNIKILSQNLKKLLAKQKRFAFRRIIDSNVRLRGEKHPHFSSTASQMLRNKKQNEKGVVQCANPQALTGQLSFICRKIVYQKAQKIFWIVNQLRTRSLLLGFTTFTSWSRNTGRQISSENSNAYEFQSNFKNNNNGSRISNKRKTTRNPKGDQIKQNSNCNGSQFSVQNQRLRNQLLSEDFEREQFSQKMHELLDYHQKYLLQGSTTTRGKKQR